MESVWTKSNEVDSYNEEEMTMFVKRKLFVARVSSVSAKQALVTYVNDNTEEDEMILRRQHALRPAESLSLREFRDESFRIPLPRKALDLARHLEEGDVIQIVQATVTYAADGTSEDVLLRAPLISGRLNREKVKTCEVIVEDNFPVKLDEMLETCEASAADATCKATAAAAADDDDNDTVSIVTENVDGEKNGAMGNRFDETQPEEMKAHESHDCDDLGERVYAQMDLIICKLTGMFLENEREQVEAVTCDNFALRGAMIRALQHLNDVEKEGKLPTSGVKIQMDVPTRAPVVQPPKTKTKQDWNDLTRKLRGESQCNERANNLKREKVSKAPVEFEQKSETSKSHRADARSVKSLETPSLLKPIDDDGWKTVMSKKNKRKNLKLRIKDLRAGDEYVGEVTDAFNFGCFINFGCEKEGLMYYAHPRRKSVGPKSRFEVKQGQKIKVRVFKADSYRRKIYLDFVHYA